MREEIYKGATRPPMIFGIPLIPFIVIAGLAILVAMWGGVLVSKWFIVGAACSALPLLMWMRLISKKDDQCLHQVILKLKLALRSKNRRLWRCRSYAPYRFRSVRDDYAR
jgi:type IV secretion system protein VirB3